MFDSPMFGYDYSTLAKVYLLPLFTLKIFMVTAYVMRNCSENLHGPAIAEKL
jgi:hypothetical protein